jgi:uncharacterized iron-regulated protein
MRSRRRTRLNTAALAFVALVAAMAGAASACPAVTSERTAAWAPSALFRADGTCTQAFETLVARVRATLDAGGAVLLGEVHDNGEQHWLRGALLNALSDGAPPRWARVYEHLRHDQQPAIDAAQRKQPPLDAVAFLTAVDWASGGWPDAALFAPLFDPAFARWPILAGDPPKGMVRDVARQGPAAVPESLRARHRLDTPLPDALQSALLDELEASHCGLVPRNRFETMALAQRVRDAWLAEQTAAAIAGHGSAVLFTGNGHVRADRGVPLYLRAVMPGRPMLTVIFIEARPGLDLAAERLAQPADIHIVTPRAEREDPCVAMRAQFGKKG